MDSVDDKQHKQQRPDRLSDDLCQACRFGEFRYPTHPTRRRERYSQIAIGHDATDEAECRAYHLVREVFDDIGIL